MTGRFPLRRRIGLRRRRPGAADAYGDPTDTWSSEEQVAVFAIVTGGAELDAAGHPQRLRHDLTVYAPAAAGIADRDRILFGDRVYEVAGPPDGYDHNPWWSPGLVTVHANRIEG